MQPEDRTIHFSVELIHGPAPIQKDVLQKLYFDLSQVRHAAYDNTDFTNPVQPRFYSRRGKKTESAALFLPDRLVLIEEWTDLPLSTFIDKVREVGVRMLEARGLRCYLLHTATIRTTFALTHFDDARVFLMDYACGQAGKIGPHFQRPVATGGLRFVLPETNEHAGILHVTIESYRHSRNEVFVEVKGVFGRHQATAEQFDIVVENIEAVRAFIRDSVFPYVNQFDHAPEASCG